MSRQLKIVELGLEKVVLDGREAALSLEKIRDACNAELARRHAAALLAPGPDGVAVIDAEQLAAKPPKVSKPAVERYLATLDKASVAPAHTPQLAERNARLAIDFAGRLTDLDTKVSRWLDEADGAVTPMTGVLWDPYSQEPMPTKQAQESAEAMRESVQDVFDLVDDHLADKLRTWTSPSLVLVPDWRARTTVAAEMRKTLELYADVMERVHNAQAVADFQRVLVEAVREASPEVAQAVVERLKDVRAARQAAMLGLDG